MHLFPFGMRKLPVLLFLVAFVPLVSLPRLSAQSDDEGPFPSFLPEGRTTAFLGVVSQPTGEGVVVSSVVPDSAAWKLGLEAGDVIEAIDGFRVGIINGATFSLPSEIRRSGQQVSLRIRDGNSGQIFDRMAKVGGPATNKGSPNLLPVLGVTSVVSLYGETVHTVTPQSPADRAGLQIGDLISFVDGYRVGVIDGNVYSLASEIRHASGSCALQVNRDGQRLTLYPQFKSTPIVGARRVHLLIVGLTKDPSIGEGITHNIAGLKETLEGIPPEKRGSAVVLEADDCNAARIIEAAQNMQVGPGDTLFCYYAGHGAYDPNQQDQGDPSGGHFFQIPGGDLFRKTLMNQLLAHQAKLTVLITDTCNVPASPADVSIEVGAPMMEEPPIVTLLLRYNGVVDISGSARDQFGWYNRKGGIFTMSLISSIASGSSTWSGLLDLAGAGTSKKFAELKQAAIDQPAGWDQDTREAILKQEDQHPQAFRFDITLE